jgi:hypothetical protein
LIDIFAFIGSTRATKPITTSETRSVISPDHQTSEARLSNTMASWKRQRLCHPHFIIIQRSDSIDRALIKRGGKIFSTTKLVVVIDMTLP